MGIYDIFRAAAKTIEKSPVGLRIFAGSTAGGIMSGFSGDDSLSMSEKIGKGIFVGGALGAGAGVAVRGLGGLAAGAERGIRLGVGSKMSSFKSISASKGYAEAARKTFLRPGTLAVAGAVVGASVAPPGSRTAGATIGAGLGFASIPALKLYKGFEHMGRVPGAQTGALIAAAAVPVAAMGVFGNGTPEGEGIATPGIGGTMDYTPLKGNMAERMLAMNATGDIVMGLHGRQHG